MKYNQAPSEDIPEVLAFEEMKQRYRSIREQNKEFFEFFDDFIEEYNNKLNAANKAVRSKEVSSGDFELYQYATKYSAEELYNAVGEDAFLQMGGQINTITKMELDKSLFEAAVAGGQVPEEVEKKVRTKHPRYKQPKEIIIP